MAHAAYCERNGRMTIGLFETIEEAREQTCDSKRIATAESGAHARQLPTYFTQQDQSYVGLKAEIETQHPL